MKRNHLPDEESADEQRKEREIIDQRLKEHFLAISDRGVPRTIKAYYLDHLHHIRLEPANKQIDGFSQHSRMYNYNYLLPFQALYLLESRQLLIYYNELPLSIAEAYKLFLKDFSEFQKYTVFSHLNRNGYFCLPHKTVHPDDRPSISKSGDRHCEDNDTVPTTPPTTTKSSEKTKPLLCDNDFVDKSFKELMDTLQAHGPREYGGNTQDRPPSDNTAISFEAYKREGFKKFKPNRTRSGCPDYYVIVQDKNSTRFPNDPALELCSDAHIRNRYLFAIIDADNSLSFVQYDMLTGHDLNIDAHF
jgi:hypothetical protein